MIGLINKGITRFLFAIYIFQPAGNFQLRFVIRFVFYLIFPLNFPCLTIDGVRQRTIYGRITFIDPNARCALLTNAVRIPLRIVIYYRLVQCHRQTCGIKQTYKARCALFLKIAHHVFHDQHRATFVQIGDQIGHILLAQLRFAGICTQRNGVRIATPLCDVFKAIEDQQRNFIWIQIAIAGHRFDRDASEILVERKRCAISQHLPMFFEIHRLQVSTHGHTGFCIRQPAII